MSRLHPRYGVKQGDPLSQLLVNFIIDELLKIIPLEIWAEVDGIKINVLAFADDLVLVASTLAGLQSLIDIAAKF